MSSTTSSARTAGHSVPVAMTLLSMSSVQLSDALSLPMIGSTGAAGTAWLRAGFGALLLLALVRPSVRSLGAYQWRPILALGMLSAMLSLSFLAALERLPLGTAVAIEFLGPLGVAAAHAGRRGARWPATAAVGVLALTEPWQGSTSLLGVLLALAAAVSWAGCIVVTSQVGDRVPGLDGIALAMPVAALCLMPWGCLQALPRLDLVTSVHGLGLAVLMPVLPHVLELTALRRLPRCTFATLMSFEPALAVLVGLVVLGQRPAVIPAVGMVLVVVAGIGATRTAPTVPTVPTPSTHPPVPLLVTAPAA
jgi:inner membrane transporter RhtA